jgi:hypothetical protein
MSRVSCVAPRLSPCRRICRRCLYPVCRAAPDVCSCERIMGHPGSTGSNAPKTGAQHWRKAVRAIPLADLAVCARLASERESRLALPVLRWDAKKDGARLRAMRHPVELSIWHAGYNKEDGRWEKVGATASAREKVCVRIHGLCGHITATQRSRARDRKHNVSACNDSITENVVTDRISTRNRNAV